MELWQPFARLVLEALYEAVICAAILNSQSTGNNNVFLTLIGGGAFGNEIDWIIDSIQRVLVLYQGYNLNVVMVSYGRSKPHVRQLVSEMSKTP
jgi:lipoprotein signal peptidase